VDSTVGALVGKLAMRWTSSPKGKVRDR